MSRRLLVPLSFGTGLFLGAWSVLLFTDRDPGHLPTALAAVGAAILVALITAVTTERRLERQLDHEADNLAGQLAHDTARQTEKLSHERDLAERAALVTILEDGLDTIDLGRDQVMSLRGTGFSLPENAKTLEAARKTLRDAEATLNRLMLRLGTDHEITIAYRALVGALSELSTAIQNEADLGPDASQAESDRVTHAVEDAGLTLNSSYTNYLNACLKKVRVNI